MGAAPCRRDWRLLRRTSQQQQLRQLCHLLPDVRQCSYQHWRQQVQTQQSLLPCQCCFTRGSRSLVSAQIRRRGFPNVFLGNGRILRFSTVRRVSVPLLFFSPPNFRKDDVSVVLPDECFGDEFNFTTTSELYGFFEFTTQRVSD